jgi:riboflavin biosynthesis pyrimidine reductase
MVRANLLVAANGATTFEGNSRKLSPKSDRERFHELRRQADILLIGGNTFRNEPYLGLYIPVYVSTRSPNRPDKSPNLEFFQLSPTQLVAHVRKKFHSILVEGGASFLSELIENLAIDELLITRVKRTGDDNYFDEELLATNYRLNSHSEAEGAIFENWVPAH